MWMYSSTENAIHKIYEDVSDKKSYFCCYLLSPQCYTRKFSKVKIIVILTRIWRWGNKLLHCLLGQMLGKEIILLTLSEIFFSFLTSWAWKKQDPALKKCQELLHTLSGIIRVISYKNQPSPATHFRFYFPCNVSFQTHNYACSQFKG